MAFLFWHIILTYTHSYTLKESIIQVLNSTEHCSQRMAMARRDHLNTWILKCKRFCPEERRQNNEVVCVNRPGQAKWSNKSVEEIYTYKSPVCRPNSRRLHLLRSDRNRSCQRWCFKTNKWLSSFNQMYVSAFRCFNRAPPHGPKRCINKHKSIFISFDVQLRSEEHKQKTTTKTKKTTCSWRWTTKAGLGEQLRCGGRTPGPPAIWYSLFTTFSILLNINSRFYNVELII